MHTVYCILNYSYSLTVFDFFLSSWVQLQLQNHPAELWEDGLTDYLSHASEIMVSFAGCKWTYLIFSVSFV